MCVEHHLVRGSCFFGATNVLGEVCYSLNVDKDGTTQVRTLSGRMELLRHQVLLPDVLCDLRVS